MSKNLRYSRIILKRTDVPTLSATTAPSTEDHTLQPAWATTDIYKGEFYLNLNDDRLYIRTTNGIREVPLANPSPRTFGDLLVFDGLIWTNSAYVPSTGITAGTSGTNGSSGSSGSSGTNGTNGTSGSSGRNGTSGSSGVSLSGGTGVNYLSGLTDVTITNIQNNEILKWNSGTAKWNNSTEYFIEQLFWSKDKQTLGVDLSGSYQSLQLKIEGRPIDILTGNTSITDDFYTCLCYSGLIITLPPISGLTSGDDYHGSIFKFKLIQSGSTTININPMDDGIFNDENYQGTFDPVTSFIYLNVFGETLTLQSNLDDKTWYVIEHSYPKYYLL